MTDMIADMLTRVRNGQMSKLMTVNVPYSKFKENVLKVMAKEGYIASFQKETVRKGVEQLVVALKYSSNGAPVIQEIHKVSKPGRRTYSAIADLKGYYNKLGLTILSTSKGVMSDRDAHHHKLGGEVICQMF